MSINLWINNNLKGQCFFPIVIEEIIQTQETCNLANGTITITATGGSSDLFYSIDGGSSFQVSPFFDNLESGDYLIIISDGVFCSEVGTTQIADAPEPLLDIDYLCVDGTNTANINLMPFDGIGPYSYEWIGPGNTLYDTEDLDGVDPGEYYITVTDALGCKIDSMIIIETCCELKVQCNQQDTVIVSCMNEVPVHDSLFLDSLSLSNEDGLAFESIGSFITSSCNDVIVNVSDSLSAPLDCLTDSLYILRTYRVFDGVTESNCSMVYIVDDYEPVNIEEEAIDMTISCSNDIEQEFQMWLSNAGNAIFSVCSEPYTFTSEPEIPQIIYECEGQGEAVVKFYINDNCGNTDSTTARFVVFDTEAPVINCPQNLIMTVQESSELSLIESWLSQASALDDCGSVTINNDYSQLELTDDCSISKDVVFTAEDDCGNSSSCISTIMIENQVQPSIQCPPSLDIECNDNNNDQRIMDWIFEASALTLDGEELLIIHDYDNAILNNATCGDVFNVSFSAEDECDREASCISSINVNDSTPPVINCPMTISIPAISDNNEETVDAWLAQVVSNDQCGSIVIQDDFDKSLLDNLCAFDYITVNFLSEDECGNSSSCNTNIQIIKPEPFILCPPQIVLECGSGTQDAEIDNWLSSAMATDNAANILSTSNDYDVDLVMMDCYQDIPVTFSTMDACGTVSECFSSIILEDTTGPQILCPDDITIDLKSEDVIARNDLWTEDLYADDECNSVALDNSVFVDVEFEGCEKTEVVQFGAEDACGNVSHCLSQVTLINHFEPLSQCPEAITVPCYEEETPIIINNFLNDISVESTIPWTVTSDFDYMSIDSDCEEEYSVPVQFIVTDECENQAYCASEIHFIPEAKVYIPNIFSPNGDGINDWFTVYGNSSVDLVLSLMVFDRWGSKRFEAYDIEPNEDHMGWDGYFNNKPEKGNVYTYIVVVRDYFGKNHHYSGSIHLIR